jgi:hypothetical protein
MTGHCAGGVVEQRRRNGVAFGDRLEHSSVPLVVGVNVITVTAKDDAGNAATATTTVTRSGESNPAPPLGSAPPTGSTRPWPHRRRTRRPLRTGGRGAAARSSLATGTGAAAAAR